MVIFKITMFFIQFQRLLSKPAIKITTAAPLMPLINCPINPAPTEILRKSNNQPQTKLPMTPIMMFPNNPYPPFIKKLAIEPTTAPKTSKYPQPD
ncbi:MAG: hypothetical protein ACI9XO_000460 [Paraglaciecola sp.]|jgi:hypothetical protein